ncbi:MAG: chromate efflux transporter [Sporichthyaceae bacterium]
MAPLERTDHGDLVPFPTAVRTWFAISLQTFGGPAGQIAVMQRVLVEEKRWIGQSRFLHALNYCMLLPGPEAQQLSIYLGWLLNGTRGGIVAGVLFILPGLIALLALSALYVGAGDTTVVAAVFAGVGPAVLVIVAQAVVRVGRRSLGQGVLLALAVAAFAALTLFAVPFPAVVLVAGVIGWALGRTGHLTAAGGHERADDGVAPVIPDSALHDARPGLARNLRVLAVCVLLWAIPMLTVAVLRGRDDVLTEEGLFFSGAALVTFGGAYAVLSYVADRAVEDFRWLAPGEMVRGLGLAESTPGPLIMVVVFVAFLGAYRDPGALNPWVAAFLGALLTMWVTFVPCFAFIFLGAPYIERLRGNRALGAALTGVTAAVVGVIASLGVYFAQHTLFAATRTMHGGPLQVESPVWNTLRGVPLVLTFVAVVLVFGLRQSLLRTLGICAVLGLLAAAVGLPVR